MIVQFDSSKGCVSANIDNILLKGPNSGDGEEPAPDINLAPSGTASASNEYDTQTAKLAVDANAGTRWIAGSQNYPGEWLQVDLGSEKTVKKTVTDFANNGGAWKYRIETSVNGSNWTIAKEKTDAYYNGVQTDTFTSVRARYVRIYMTDCSPLKWASIDEFEVWGY